MDLFGAVRQALRISHDKMDDEVGDLIAAARGELLTSGVASAKVHDDDDPLIRRAIVVYAKAHFGFDNPDHERLVKSFNGLAAKLSLATGYKEESADAMA